MMRLKCKYITMSGKCQKHSTPEVNEYCLGSPCEDYEGYGTKEVVPRYIDADALIEDIKHGLWDWETVNGIESRTVLEQTIQDIRNEPTIDAEPVRHGKWIYKEYNLTTGESIGYFVCSECGCVTANEIGSYYCFHCGAKMDEVNDD